MKRDCGYKYPENCRPEWCVWCPRRNHTKKKDGDAL